MLTKQVDSRERVFRPIPISYLIQTANQFDCDIFVTSDKHTANVKQYDEVKNLRMIISALQNTIPYESIKERIRPHYGS